MQIDRSQFDKDITIHVLLYQTGLIWKRHSYLFLQGGEAEVMIFLDKLHKPPFRRVISCIEGKTLWRVVI